MERQTLSDRQIVGTLMAAGAKDLELPSLTDVLADFDEALAAEPVPESPRLMLLRDLGVA